MMSPRQWLNRVLAAGNQCWQHPLDLVLSSTTNRLVREGTSLYYTLADHCPTSAPTQLLLRLLTNVKSSVEETTPIILLFCFFYCYRIAIFDHLGSVTCEMIELKYGTIDYDGNRELTYNGTTPCRHLRTKQEGRCWITYNEIRVNCAYVTSVKLKKSPKPPAVCTAFSTYMATLSQHDLHGHVAFCAMSSESYIPVQHDAFDWLFWQHFWTRQIKIQIQMGICRALLTNCPGALTKCQNAMWNRWDFRYVFESIGVRQQMILSEWHSAV